MVIQNASIRVDFIQRCVLSHVIVDQLFKASAFAPLHEFSEILSQHFWQRFLTSTTGESKKFGKSVEVGKSYLMLIRRGWFNTYKR